jgi:predicted transcriptional regulator
MNHEKAHLTKYRSREEILSTILKVVSEGGATQSDIMYKASMNFRLIKKYVSFLLINGLLIREGATYKITDNGMFFLRIYNQLNEMI